MMHELADTQCQQAIHAQPAKLSDDVLIILFKKALKYYPYSDNKASSISLYKL
jgi:hypothetical protein